MKKRLHEILEEARPGDQASRSFDIFLISLITLNAVALILGTVEGIHELSPQAFLAIEVVSVAIFTVEYVLRVWACTVNPKYAHPVTGRLRFMFSPIVLIDLLAIAPFYVALFPSLHKVDLRLLRAVRLLARLARLGRYFSGLRTLSRVVYAKRSELLTVLLVLSILLFIASSLMYFAENGAQPDKFANIPQAIWWSVITLTTVGYGDVVPVTVMGRLLAGVIAIVGIGLFALPAGILGSGFIEEIRGNKDAASICPHCNREIGE